MKASLYFSLLFSVLRHASPLPIDADAITVSGWSPIPPDTSTVAARGKAGGFEKILVETAASGRREGFLRMPQKKKTGALPESMLLVSKSAQSDSETLLPKFSQISPQDSKPSDSKKPAFPLSTLPVLPSFSSSPSQSAPAKEDSIPLVLFLHPWMPLGEKASSESERDRQRVEEIEEVARLSEYADAYGFALAFPVGLNGLFGNAAWNAGEGCCQPNATVNDVEFLERFVDTLLNRDTPPSWGAELPSVETVSSVLQGSASLHGQRETNLRGGLRSSQKPEKTAAEAQEAFPSPTVRLDEKKPVSLRLDPSRVFAFGFSNGGGMVELLLCTSASVRLRGAVSVGGASFTKEFPSCHPNASVKEGVADVLLIHGRQDSVVSWEANVAGFVPHASLEDDFDRWVAEAGAREGGSCEEKEGSVEGEVSRRSVVCEDPGKGPRQRLELLEILVGGHEWYRSNRFDSSAYALKIFGLTSPDASPPPPVIPEVERNETLRVVRSYTATSGNGRALLDPGRNYTSFSRDLKPSGCAASPFFEASVSTDADSLSASLFANGRLWGQQEGQQKVEFEVEEPEGGRWELKVEGQCKEGAETCEVSEVHKLQERSGCRDRRQMTFTPFEVVSLRSPLNSLLFLPPSEEDKDIPNGSGKEVGGESGDTDPVLSSLKFRTPTAQVSSPHASKNVSETFIGGGSRERERGTASCVIFEVPAEAPEYQITGARVSVKVLQSDSRPPVSFPEAVEILTGWEEGDVRGRVKVSECEQTEDTSLQSEVFEAAAVREEIERGEEDAEERHRSVSFSSRVFSCSFSFLFPIDASPLLFVLDYGDSFRTSPTTLTGTIDTWISFQKKDAKEKDILV
uniref:Phospholipase/carboxylesterase/thioesterase domain-containing protein n=1 Tax=Chromera velia CCMP2878 TaxID=1169474 RepID=A0A0G4GA22_9ALVE|eukprot:Cvel_20944.t1-p1 / transcript=Cvel_20944.t1 / gene=Cvel_20944 / organism=Chromera_velia_CCMP2878 / gene_product=hypothetical protein / transcript_product=hypothetical protein / location=Cvel_scaffold1924:13839-16403(+) / protein_length=855 / sequence_SO=supercontig / SO=protein_coding / is_pseudo=false